MLQAEQPRLGCKLGLAVSPASLSAPTLCFSPCSLPTHSSDGSRRMGWVMHLLLPSGMTSAHSESGWASAVSLCSASSSASFGSRPSTNSSGSASHGPVMHWSFLLGLDAQRALVKLLFRGRHLVWNCILPSTSQQLKSWFGNVLTP